VGWAAKADYKRLSGELAESEGRGFQRKCLPLLRVIWPEAMHSTDLGGADSKGIDILVWRDGALLPLVVQCKGFKVTEKELGDSQIKQCSKSIESFSRSGFKAEMYILVHNREAKDEHFRHSIDTELEKLRQAGHARKAVCWDRQTFVKKILDAMLVMIKTKLLSERRTAGQNLAEEEQLPCVPLEAVPYSTALLEVDQYTKLKFSSEQENLADPADELFHGAHHFLSVLIGEFGVGKTTVAMRALSRKDSKVLYVRGAELKDGIVGTRDLLAATVDFDELLSHVPLEDREVVTRVARGTLDYLFKDAHSPLVLLIDGLDESVFANRAGGLQWLFNCLWEVQVPVIVTTRTEHWYAQQTDLASSVGLRGKQVDAKRHQTIKLVELKPWTPAQIVLLARRFRETLQEDTPRGRIDELVSLVESGTYTEYYGDIPVRPLFLRLILETVAEHGIHRVGRVGLLAEAINQKVLRDVDRPLRDGGRGRPPLFGEDRGRDAVLQTSWRAMYAAARLMVREVEGSVELLPHCSFDDLRRSDPGLDDIRDATALVLHSLLVPTAARQPGMPVSLRFAHRAFQEFLLARVLLDDPRRFAKARIPNEVDEWRQVWLSEQPETPLGPLVAYVYPRLHR
jgi:hypothetical protein